MPARAYIVRPAVAAPVALSAVAVGLAAQESWWFLAALPFIWLGSICAQPNLNLADGCLAYVAILGGLVVLAASRPLGIAIAGGAGLGLWGSAIEKRLRMIPATDAELATDTDEQKTPKK